MTSIFAGIIFMNSVMPVRVRKSRGVSRTHLVHVRRHPILSRDAICEVPRVLLVTFVTVTRLYFMVGLVPTFEHYIFHVLMVFTVSMAFMSLGQLIAWSMRDHPNRASWRVCLHPYLLPLNRFVPPYSQIPAYWKWAYFIDPVAYAIQGVTAPQFEHRGCTGAYPDGDCPTIQAFRGTYFETVDTLALWKKIRRIQLSQNGTC